MMIIFYHGGTSVMKKIFLGIFIGVFIVACFGVALAQQNAIIGTWQNYEAKGDNKGKAKAHNEIFEKDGAYFGKTTKVFLVPENKLCDKCKGDLKNKPVVGLIFLQGMKKTGNVDEELGEEYAGGTVMDPDKGETFKCKIWVKGNILTLRGYVGFLYETQQWTRVK